VVVAVAAAVLCAVLLHRRRAAAALAAKVRQESQGVAMVDGFSHDDSYGPESGPLAPPGPGHRGLWFYEQLHASLVRAPSRRRSQWLPSCKPVCWAVHRQPWAAACRCSQHDRGLAARRAL